MRTIDVDNNEYIEYTDFIAVTLDKKLYLDKERLWAVFKQFDIENTNYITIDNLREVMKRKGKEIP